MTPRPWQFILVQLLTIMRLPLILIFFAVSVSVDASARPGWFVVAFGAMILSAVTDLFDGYLARRWNATSQIGAHADPLCDKFFYLIAFPTLVYLSMRLAEPSIFHTRLLLVLTVFYLMRDQWVSFLRSIGAIHGVPGTAQWIGKVRTFISFPVICVIYYYLQAPPQWVLQIPLWLVYTCEWALLIINIYSIYSYTAYYWPTIRSEMKPPSKAD